MQQYLQEIHDIISYSIENEGIQGLRRKHNEKLKLSENLMNRMINCIQQNFAKESEVYYQKTQRIKNKIDCVFQHYEEKLVNDDFINNMIKQGKIRIQNLGSVYQGLNTDDFNKSDIDIYILLQNSFNKNLYGRLLHSIYNMKFKFKKNCFENKIQVFQQQYNQQGENIHIEIKVCYQENIKESLKINEWLRENLSIEKKKCIVYLKQMFTEMQKYKQLKKMIYQLGKCGTQRE